MELHLWSETFVFITAKETLRRKMPDEKTCNRAWEEGTDKTSKC